MGLIIINKFEKMPKDVLAQMCAVLKVVSFGDQMVTTSVTALHKVGKLFGKKFIDKPKSMEEKIKREYEALSEKSASELAHNLIDILSEKFDTQNRDTTDIDRSLLEGRMLDAAALGLNINETLTDRRKAEAIANEVRSVVYNKMLEKMSAEEKKKMVDAIGDKFETMSGEEKDAMLKALNVSEHSAEAVKKALIAGGVPLLINAGGFASYIALTTIIHTIGTTLLGVTLPFAVYTGAATGLSVLAGPVGWALIGGFGLYQYKKGNKKILGAVCQQIVLQAQMTYPGMSFFVDKEAIYGKWLSGKYSEEAIKKKTEDFERQLRETEDLEKTKKEIELYIRNAKEELAAKKRELTQFAEMKDERKILEERIVFFESQERLLQQKVREKEEENERLRKQRDEVVAKYNQRLPDALLNTKEVLEKLEKGLREATIEADIASPWISGRLLDKTNSIRRALHDAIMRRVTVKIIFGMTMEDDPDKLEGRDRKVYETAKKIAKEYASYSNFHIGRVANHAKYFLCDDKWYIHTSLNMLSKSSEESFDDDGAVYYDKSHLQALRKNYFEHVDGKNVDKLITHRSKKVRGRNDRISFND